MTDIRLHYGRTNRKLLAVTIGAWIVSLTSPRLVPAQIPLPVEAAPSEVAIPSGTSELPAADASSVVVPCHKCGHTASLCGCYPRTPPAHETDCGSNLFWYGPWLDPCNGDPCQGPHCMGVPTGARSNWYVLADLVPLMRDQNDDVVFQTLGRGGEPVLDTDDCADYFDAGTRVGLGYTLGPWYRLEANYLGAYEWNDRTSVWDFGLNGHLERGRLFSPFSNFGQPFGVPGLDFNQFAAVEMNSKFSGVELNLRRRWNLREQRYHYAATSFLIGLRYMNVDERLLYLTESAVPGDVGAINDIGIWTDNDLIGVQLGWLSQFMVHRRGWIDFEIKGGIYDNRGSVNTLLTAADGDGFVEGQFGYSDARDRTSFMGELSLSYSHHLTSMLTFRAGYNAMWLTGLALASQNLPTDINLLTLGPAQVQQCGDVVYHGPHVGFVLAW